MGSSEGREIYFDFRTMFFYVLKKWRWLLLLLCIGLAFGFAYSYIKVKTNKKDDTEARILSMGETPQLLQYIDYRKMYDSQLAYEEDSLLLNLDPEAVWTGEVRFYVTASSEKIDEVGFEYTSLLRNNGRIDELIEAFGADLNERQIKEIASISFTKNEADGETNAKSLRSAIVSGISNAADEETCRRLINAIEAMIEGKSAELSSHKVTGFYSKKLNNYVQYGFNSSVQKQIQSAIETRKSYLTQINSLEEQLTADEKLYYAYHYEGMAIPDAKMRFSLKWPILFGIAGFLVAALWFSITFVLSDTIKTSDEINNRYGINILALVPVNDERSFVDRLINRWECAGYVINSPEYAYKSIQLLDFNSVLLCCDKFTQDEEKLLQKIKGSDTRIRETGSPCEDSNAQEGIKNSDGCILIVRLSSSRNKEIRQDIQKITALDSKVLGAVVLK